MKYYIYIIIVLLMFSCSEKKDKAMVFYNIDQAIKAPKETKALKLTKDDLTVFQDHIDLFPNLETLMISNTKWVIINYDGKVDPASMTVISLPSNLVRLKNLRTLLLDNYYIDGLPNNISTLDKIESMKFAYTYKADLKAEVNKIKAIRSLREVDLTNSTITPSVIRDAFKEAPNVKLILMHSDIEPQY